MDHIGKGLLSDFIIWHLIPILKSENRTLVTCSIKFELKKQKQPLSLQQTDPANDVIKDRFMAVQIWSLLTYMPISMIKSWHFLQIEENYQRKVHFKVRAKGNKLQKKESLAFLVWGRVLIWSFGKMGSTHLCRVLDYMLVVCGKRKT